jgi:ketosteroid isomerase-like protein
MPRSYQVRPAILGRWRATRRDSGQAAGRHGASARPRFEEYIDAGGSVVTVTRWRATGKGSALVIDLHSAEVFEFADGRVIRATVGYADRAVALKAVPEAGQWPAHRD